MDYRRALGHGKRCGRCLRCGRCSFDPGGMHYRFPQTRDSGGWAGKRGVTVELLARFFSKAVQHVTTTGPPAPLLISQIWIDFVPARWKLWDWGSVRCGAVWRIRAGWMSLYVEGMCPAWQADKPQPEREIMIILYSCINESWTNTKLSSLN